MRRCQARPFGPPLRVLLRLVMCHSRDVVATHCHGGVTLTASNWPVWIPNLNYSPYSHCCPLLYPSQPAGSISSCPQLTLTEVTHFVDPQSGSLVTVGHTAPTSNTRDVILNGISDSRIMSTGDGDGNLFVRWKICCDNYCHPPTKLQEGNVFSRHVCLSTPTCPCLCRAPAGPSVQDPSPLYGVP